LSPIDWGKKLEAKQAGGQVEEPLAQGSPSLVADAEATTAEQPGERALDHPAVSTEPLGGLDAAPCDPRRDAPSPERTLQVRGIASLVGMELRRALAGRPGFPRNPTMGGIASTSRS
jgi:hypothetical protein